LIQVWDKWPKCLSEEKQTGGSPAISSGPQSVLKSLIKC